MNTEQLKLKLQALQEQNQAVLREKAEVARLNALINLQSNERLLEAQARLYASAQQTKVLQDLVDQCQAIVDSTPIHNPKTRQNRKWAGSYRNAYGPQIGLMYQLATGILYAAQEHKTLMLAVTGLDLQFIEQFVKAFGNTAYYNRNYNTVVEEQPADFEMMKAVVDVMQSNLQVVVDTSTLTQKAVETEFTRAALAAEQQYTLALEAISEADFEI